MSDLVLPDWVDRRERLRRVSETAREGVAQTRYWNPLLKEIDPRLELVYVGATDVQELIPFRWHILRHNESGPDTFWPIVGPGDSFREMAEDWLHRLRAGDLWNPQVRHDIATANRRVEASKERAKETRKEARVDELAMNIKALESPSVLFSGDLKWSAKPAGKRGRKPSSDGDADTRKKKDQ